MSSYNDDLWNASEDVWNYSKAIFDYYYESSPSVPSYDKMREEHVELIKNIGYNEMKKEGIYTNVLEEFSFEEICDSIDAIKYLAETDDDFTIDSIIEKSCLDLLDANYIKNHLELTILYSYDNRKTNTKNVEKIFLQIYEINGEGVGITMVAINHPDKDLIRSMIENIIDFSRSIEGYW